MPWENADEGNNNDNMREIDVSRILQGDVYYEYQSIILLYLGHSLSQWVLLKFLRNNTYKMLG